MIAAKLLYLKIAMRFIWVRITWKLTKKCMSARLEIAEEWCDYYYHAKYINSIKSLSAVNAFMQMAFFPRSRLFSYRSVEVLSSRHISAECAGTPSDALALTALFWALLFWCIEGFDVFYKFNKWIYFEHAPHLFDRQ